MIKHVTHALYYIMEGDIFMSTIKNSTLMHFVFNDPENASFIRKYATLLTSATAYHPQYNEKGRTVIKSKEVLIKYPSPSLNASMHTFEAEKKQLLYAIEKAGGVQISD